MLERWRLRSKAEAIEYGKRWLAMSEDQRWLVGRTEVGERVKYRIQPRSDGGWAVEWRGDLHETWSTLPYRFPSAELAKEFLNDRT